MHRRQFLKLCGLGSLALGLPFTTRLGRAGSAAYGGPFWVLVHAGGAWDPRFLFDPTTSADQNRYSTSVGAVGNIQYSDFPVDVARWNLDKTQGYEAFLMSNKTFLTKRGGQFTVLNGIDTSTNNHEAGTRATWSGRLLGEYPAFGALVAASKAPDLPMAFISGGGYDVTDRLVPLARSGSPDTLAKIAFPALINPTNAAPDRYHTEDTAARIAAASRARLDALRKASSLPREQTAMDELGRARAASLDLSRLTLPTKLIDIPGNQLDDLQRLMQGAQVAVSAFKSGVAAVATLTLGGFDTHGNHDRDQPRQIAKLLHGVDFLLQEAEAAGIAGQLYVVVGSDFGRGPTYNAENAGAGKDHWPVTSMLVSGPGIPGNRVVGATDTAFKPRPIDPGSLAPSDGGVVLSPELIHTALRRVAGVEAIGAKYPLDGAALPLFG
jgi:uncharacterized protein (DUF1501 family)